jgi:cell cycle checkpoint protein
MTKMEQESLEMVTQRESTLGIFHAVGRVVYNKRIPDDPSGPPVPQPPHWFPERRRPKASEVQLESLIDELGTDTQTFITALHENYVLSCEGTDEEETMDAIDGCIESLSDADLLSPDRFGHSGFGKRNFQGTSSDTLRQDEMSFQACVRGLLYNLPSPVKRINPPPGVMGIKGKGSAKGSAYVMYYPTSLRIWREQEEIGGLIDLWISRIQQGKLFRSKSAISKPAVARTGGVDTWRRSTAFDSEKASTSAGPKDENADSIPVLLGSGGSARYEMLLERLPYLARILQKKSLPSAATAGTIRELRRITTFTGTNVTDDQDDDADNEPLENEQWTTDRPGSDTPRKRTRNKIISKASTGDALTGIVEKEVKSLVLSDDDIED